MLLCRAASIKVKPPRFREKSNSTHRCCSPHGPTISQHPVGLTRVVFVAGAPLQLLMGLWGPGEPWPSSTDHSWEDLLVGQGHPDPRPPAKRSRPQRVLKKTIPAY